MSDKKESQTAFQLCLTNDERDLKIEAERPDLSNAQWVAAAKVGQVVDIKTKLCSVTAESLESSLGTWKGRKIFKNHETEIKDHTILDEKFENPFLSFLLDNDIVAALANGGGGSIDAIATLVEEGKIRNMSGVGYSVLDKDKMPACTKEAGCGIAAEGGTEEKGDSGVNIGGDIRNPNINLEEGKVGDEANSPQNQNKNKGDEKAMVDKKDEKEEVSFSQEQVGEITAAAVVDKAEQMTASHKVELNDLQVAHAAELKALGETHLTEMETQRMDVQKHVEMVEALTTKFALSPDAKKELIDAKSVEEVYTFLGKLKVEKAEPVIAAEGKGETTGCGIVMGSEVEGKAPETIQIEQVGDYDPLTGKYVPSYREEVK